MIKFLSIIAIFFATDLISYATETEDTLLLEKAQLYMNLMEEAGQCEDIQTNEEFKAEIYNLFAEDFVKIVNGDNALASHQALEEGDLDQRKALINQLIAARSTFGNWAFPTEFISLSEIHGQYKIQIQARTVAPKDDVELSILKILTFNESNKICRLDEAFLKIR